MPNPQDLIFKQMLLGPMDNFSYIIGESETKTVFIVDPAFELKTLTQYLDENHYQLKGILLTHGHYDHTLGVPDLLSQHDVPVYISKYETYNGSNRQTLEDKQNISLGDLTIQCLLTPGHAPGAMCFKLGNILLTGDTLFIDGCGRCDLGGGDPEQMYDSLYNVIMKLPDSTVIYPGHDYGDVPFATLGEQKRTNPYLLSKDLKDFLEKRMGY